MNNMDLSVWGMYQHADIIVKLVMISLLIASVINWTMMIAKGTELWRAARRLRDELAILATASNLNEACQLAVQFPDNSISRILLFQVQDEWRLSKGCGDSAGIKERATFRLERRVAAISREMGRGNGWFATTGAIAPFVGLFGTVWGIMNSFIGIAQSQTTHLAVVAPGIAEALLATALGLVAAIPAVLIYNIFVRLIASYRMQVSDIAAGALLLLSRDLDFNVCQEVTREK